MNRSFATATIVNARLGSHPRKNITQSGQEISTFNVAYDSGYGKNTRTIWVSCTVYGTMAEICNKYLRKGSNISLSGALSTQEWIDSKDETTKSKIHIRIDNIVFNGDERKAESNYGISRGTKVENSSIGADDYESFKDYDNEIADELKKPQKEVPPFKCPDID